MWTDGGHLENPSTLGEIPLLSTSRLNGRFSYQSLTANWGTVNVDEKQTQTNKQTNKSETQSERGAEKGEAIHSSNVPWDVAPQGGIIMPQQ